MVDDPAKGSGRSTGSRSRGLVNCAIATCPVMRFFEGMQYKCMKQLPEER
jgi:hypothetical protein